jgi:hypothetical protein
LAEWSNVSKLKVLVLGNLLDAWQKQTNTNAPANFEDLPFVRKRTGWQDGANPLRLIEGFAGKRLFLSSLKKMHANIRISFAFGQPDHRCFDGVNVVLRLKRHCIFALQKVARLKHIDVAFESDLDGRFG